jgi:hypothetical protein
MAELAVTDGMPPPADLPRGECLLTRFDDGRVRIDQADPRILISGELLDTIADAPHDVFVVGTGGGAYVVAPGRSARLDTTACQAAHGYAGAVLHIHGVNRTVIYRIGEYVPRVHAYIAEWPD